MAVCKVLWECQRKSLDTDFSGWGADWRVKEGFLGRLGPEDCRRQQGCTSRKDSKRVKTQSIWHVSAAWGGTGYIRDET